MMFKPVPRSWSHVARATALVTMLATVVAQSGCASEVDSQPGHDDATEGSTTVEMAIEAQLPPAPRDLSELPSPSPNDQDEVVPRALPLGWLIVFAVFTIGSLIWTGYSSGWDFRDYATAEAAAQKLCGAAILQLCQSEFTPAPGKEWTGNATFSYTIHWRLFFTGWWYRFSCGQEYTCEVRCVGAGAQGCGQCPNPAPDCCEAQPDCGGNPHPIPVETVAE